MAQQIKHWIVIEKDNRDEHPAWSLHSTGQGRRTKDTRKAARKATRTVRGLGREPMGLLLSRSVPPCEILAQLGDHPAVVERLD